MFVEKGVTKKIKALQTYYSNNFSKMLNSKKGGAETAEVYQSQWGHLNAMTFLGDIPQPRKTTTTMVRYVECFQGYI